jgi:hypothetical protein
VQDVEIPSRFPFISPPPLGSVIDTGLANSYALCRPVQVDVRGGNTGSSVSLDRVLHVAEWIVGLALAGNGLCVDPKWSAGIPRHCFFLLFDRC